MHKPLIAVVIPAFTLGMLVLGQVQAQQTPPANQSSKPATSQSTGPAAKTPAKKAPVGSAKTGAAVTLKTQREKASYALGMSIGTGMHRQGLPVDPALVSRGLRDAMAGGKTLLTEDEMKAALQQLRGQVQQAQESKAQAESAGNRKAGEAFLTANKSKEGVKTLPDGLQYKVINGIAAGGIRGDLRRRWGNRVGDGARRAS